MRLSFSILGGTTLASLLIGQPIRFLTSDKLVVAMLAAWYTNITFLNVGLQSSAFLTILAWNSFKILLFEYHTMISCLSYVAVLPLLPTSQYLLLCDFLWRWLRFQKRPPQGQSGFVLCFTRESQGCRWLSPQARYLDVAEVFCFATTI